MIDPTILKKSIIGLTLIELLIVIAIIAILATVGVGIFSGQQKNARDARRKIDVEAISTALEVHYNYQANQFCTGDTNTYCTPLTGWFSSGGVPKDPQTGSDYATLPVDGASSYNVCATLEAGGTFCKASQQQ